MFISSDFAEIVSVEALIDRLFTEHFSDSDIYGNMLIAVTEAVNNAIVHGNKLDRNKQVNVVVESTDESLSFTVKDEGVGFDFDHLPDPTAPENIEKENGRGIYLMRSLSDDVCFTGNGSVVTITFNK